MENPLEQDAISTKHVIMQCFPTPWILYLKRKYFLELTSSLFFHLAGGGVRIEGKNDNAMKRFNSTKEIIDHARLLNK